MKTIRFLQAKDGRAIGDVAAYPGVIADKWIARGIATADLTPAARSEPKPKPAPLPEEPKVEAKPHEARSQSRPSGEKNR